MCYGIIFQEYHQLRSGLPRGQAKVLTAMWVALTTVLAMAYVGNLKASLVRKDFETRTASLGDMIDRDMEVHTAAQLYNFFNYTRHQTYLNERLTCQIEKRKSIHQLT